MILHEQNLIFESKNNIFSVKVNQSNNCCLYSLESKDSICIKPQEQLNSHDKFQVMIKIYDESVKVNHKQNWPCIPDHCCRTLNIGCPESGKTNLSLNLNL